MSGQRASFAHASSSDMVLRIGGSIVLSATGAATDQLKLTTVTVQRACTKQVASKRPARMCYNGYGEKRSMIKISTRSQVICRKFLRIP